MAEQQPDTTFTLKQVATQGACTHCNGLTTLHVIVGTEVIGAIIAEWPWSSDIPEDPERHPATPHYAVDWYGYTPGGEPLAGITATTPYYIGRAIYDRHIADTQVAARS